MRSSDIRKLFLNYFKENGHLVMPSSSLIPDDPTLLLTAAGMVQFKPYFLNLAEPPHSRITTVQKCVRTSDIERVGETARHLTFFEMLGNFSFGDYYKKEAIGYAVDFLFNVLNLDRERFWVTVYEEDDEAFEIWSKEFGFPEEKIVRLGKEDNFWEAGPVGPCGPCSELIIDRGEKYGCGREDCKPGCDCDRFLEIWNLVFMQFNKNEDGSLTPLPKKNIDTGMGLERISLILQEKENVFETDLLFPVLKKVSEITGRKYKENELTDRSLKIITDHLKAATFLLADGVLPSNEGRGYILRRLIRRSISHSRKLGFEGKIAEEVSKTVIDMFKDVYPELGDNQAFIINMLNAEEDRFLQVLDRGLAMLKDEVESLKKFSQNLIPDEVAFKLYDTYGFPIELTVELAGDEGFQVDIDGFYQLLEESKERSRKSWKGRKFTYDVSLYEKLAKKLPFVEFTGYEKDEDEADILAILKEGSSVDECDENDKVEIVLSQTPFYPESGGQVGDTGKIVEIHGNFEIQIEDTQKPVEGLIVHTGRVLKGKPKVGSRVKARIDVFRRRNIERNHTATHLLHWALRLVLGEGVKQAGSYVGPDYFRFDFPFERPLKREEIEKIERLVNLKIAEAHPVKKFETTIDYARQIGAIALFGEKYGEYVRVVESGDFSRELCGGTHVNNTAQISLFVIKSEHSIGSGLRRIEALTGARAIEVFLNQLNTVRRLEETLKVPFDKFEAEIQKILEELNTLRQKEKISEKEKFNREIEEIIKNSREIADVKIVKGIFKDKTNEELKQIVDKAREKFENFAAVLGLRDDKKAGIIVAFSKKLVDKGLDASAIVKSVAKVIGGGGGGSSFLAEGGGRYPEKIQDAVEAAEKIIVENIEKFR